ncbi:MAG: hypothetical protein ACE5JU_04730 [Candidatus Binatia bacterium]
MKTLLALLISLVILPSTATAARTFNWRALRVGQSTAKDAKKVLGKPLQEYREQLLYEKKHLHSGDPKDQPIRLDTVVLNLGPKGIIESIFLFPEWGTTDEQLRLLFGKGRKMKYGKFLSSKGKVKIGAGTRPDEKLHYVNLDTPCEVYPKLRVLVVYSRQDVVTGNYLVQLILFY